MLSSWEEEKSVTSRCMTDVHFSQSATRYTNASPAILIPGNPVIAQMINFIISINDMTKSNVSDYELRRILCKGVNKCIAYVLYSTRVAQQQYRRACSARLAHIEPRVLHRNSAVG